MRDLVVSALVSLDGVMQAPAGPAEDQSGGFAYGGWSVPAWDEAMAEAMADAMEAPFELLLGRRTYEILAARSRLADDPLAAGLGEAKKYVVSNRLRSADWQNSVLVGGDVVTKVRELKAKDGPELQVHGSGTLVRALAAHGLVDEYRLWIYPLVLGKGKRLFGDAVAASALRLVDARISSTGVMLNVYRTSGPVELGALAVEAPVWEAERREVVMSL
jgi:dihydrofolate reductase